MEVVNFFVFIIERNVGLGTGVFWARIGGVMAPQIILLVGKSIISKLV